MSVCHFVFLFCASHVVRSNFPASGLSPFSSFVRDLKKSLLHIISSYFRSLPSLFIVSTEVIIVLICRVHFEKVLKFGKVVIIALFNFKQSASEVNI